MTKKLFTISLATLLIQNISICQDTSITELMDGVYLSYDEMLNNSPAMSLDILKDYRNETGKVCLPDGKHIITSYGDQINVNDMWGFTVNGNTYLNLWRTYYHKNAQEEVCFFKLQKIESLSIFVSEQVKGNSVAWSYPVLLLTGYSRPHIEHVKVEEFVYELRTGRVLSIRSSFHSIVAILRTDEYFTKIKIKRNDMIFHIMNYNKRNPVINGVSKTVTNKH